MPFFSIITTTYNHERFISDCLKSVMEQTFTDWEMIIIDDGSTDQTLSMVKAIVNTDDRISVISQTNIGLESLGLTYNTALSKASGEYVCILEGDDLWMRDKLSRVYDAVSRDIDVGPAVIWSAAKAIDEHGKILSELPTGKYRPTSDTLVDQIKFLNSYLLASFIPSPTLVFRKNILDKIGGFQQPEGMNVVDYPTVLNASLHGPVLFQDDCLAAYRVHGSQATSSGHVHLDAAGKYAHTFYESNSKKLNDLNITSRMLIGNIQYRESLNRFFLGRTALKNKRYKIAKEQFKIMMDCKNMSIKLRGVVGLLHVMLRSDMEWIARLMKKRPIK